MAQRVHRWLDEWIGGTEGREGQVESERER